MAVSKEVYAGCCSDYLGFYREILIKDNQELVIYFCRNGYDEKIFYFRKKYLNYADLLKSLCFYIDILKEQEKNIPVNIKTSEVLTDDIFKQEKNKLGSDFIKKCVFLPDNGNGFSYG